MMQHSLTVICTHLIIRSYYLIILIFSSLIFKLFMLLFSYFRTTEQNRHCFVQFANQKFKSHLLTPESYELKKNPVIYRILFHTSLSGNIILSPHPRFHLQNSSAAQGTKFQSAKNRSAHQASVRRSQYCNPRKDLPLTSASSVMYLTS